MVLSNMKQGLEADETKHFTSLILYHQEPFQDINASIFWMANFTLLEGFFIFEP